MNPVVSIVAQGAMGAATAARLVEHGVEVRTSLTARSASSAERAARAGMKAVDDDALVDADFLLSIVPPADAVPLADRLSPALARAARKPIYVDLNAISPATAAKVAAIVDATGAPFVDGGIIGGPPRVGYDGPTYYVSGADAKKVEALAAFGLKVKAIEGPIGAASALKMSYAGITKGLVCLASSMMLAAQRAGVSDALFRELSASQVTLLAGFARSVPDMFPKAGRWVAEMREIADFVLPNHAEHNAYSAFAEFYARICEDAQSVNAETKALREFFRVGGKS